MSPEYKDLTWAVVGGTLVLLLLLSFIMLFLVFYERKKFQHNQELHQLELIRQRELMKAAIHAQEKERQYIAEELHDSLGQVLSAIRMNLATLMQQAGMASGPWSDLLDATKQLTSDAIQEVRSISHRLMPNILLDFGLVAALQDITRKSLSDAFKISFQSDLPHRLSSKELELALFRIAQEMLSNGMKHAGNSVVELKLRMTPDEILLSYSDNGKGFSVDQLLTQEGNKGLGFQNMKSRLGLWSGTLSIHSEPGKGVEIIASVPREAEQAA